MAFQSVPTTLLFGIWPNKTDALTSQYEYCFSSQWRVSARLLILVEETCISFHWPRKNQPYKQQSQLIQKVVLVIMFYFKISLFPTHLRIHHPAFLKIKIKWRIFVQQFQAFDSGFSTISKMFSPPNPQENFGKPRHPTSTRKMIKFSSNQGRLREEIFVNSRQPTLHKKNSSCQGRFRQ